MLRGRLAWGFRSHGVLCSVWSSSAVTHSLFHRSCSNLHFISVEHLLLCSPDVVRLNLRSAPFKLCCTRSKGTEQSALQSSPAQCSHAGRQLRLFPRLSSLPGQPKAWPWLCLATSRAGF